MLSMIAAIAYGILVIVGGIMGYAQARSKASLISGIISGILLIFGGILQLQGQAWGLTLAIIVSAILVVVFTIRFVKTRKFMPAGLMTILGIIALAVMINQVMS